MIRKLLTQIAVLLAAAGAGGAMAAEAGYPLDYFPTEKLTQMPALQNGAKIFVNHCLNCHNAALMRYNRLTDIGLSEEQIKKYLVFGNAKVGDPMRTPMNPLDAKEWFGATPPDLTVSARARNSQHGSGADWIYTYLRAYYRDATRPSGWNNAVFPNVGMPHVFWNMQGSRGAIIEDIKEVKDEKSGEVQGWAKTTVTFTENGVRSEKTEKLVDYRGHAASKVTLGRATGGTMDAQSYDDMVADLVAYMAYMADPTANTRMRLGVWVLLFLGVFFVFVWRLNAA
jgi:ubiquinol-cytochrome c reductase cytochrome c1 subunit